jgi:hypothetical protein
LAIESSLALWPWCYDDGRAPRRTSKALAVSYTVQALGSITSLIVRHIYYEVLAITQPCLIGVGSPLPLKSLADLV